MNTTLKKKSSEQKQQTKFEYHIQNRKEQL